LLLLLSFFYLGQCAPPNLSVMTKYTVLSYAAACRVGLKEWTCFWCKYLPPSQMPPVTIATVVESDGVYGTYGYVGHSSKEILIAFRGSQTFSNWIHDFEFWPSDYPGVPGARIHHGFYSAYLAVQDQVEKTVAQLVKLYPHLPVTVTGHSLGAALSVACAMELMRKNVVPGERLTVINIGLPRVGNKPFATYFDQHVSNHYRIVNQRDIVPHFPPEIMGFWHVSTEIWFPTNYTSYKVCNGSGEDPNCSDSVIDLSTYDHVHYLGIYAGDGNPDGCGSPPPPPN